MAPVPPLHEHLRSHFHRLLFDGNRLQRFHRWAVGSAALVACAAAFIPARNRDWNIFRKRGQTQ